MKQSRPRASDAQRSAVQQALDEAFAAGRLDHFEHFERIRTATKAKYVDELRPLVADLRGGDDDLGLNTPPPRTGTTPERSGRGGTRGLLVSGGIAVATLAVIGAIAVSAGPDGSFDSDESSFGPLFTLDGAGQMLDEAGAEFGTQPIDALTIYGNRASLMREDPVEDDKRLSYQFRGGWEETGFSSRTDSATFRVTDVEADEFITALEAAAGELGTDLDETGHVFISADVLGQPEYRVSVYEGDDISTVTVGSDGEIRKVHEN